MRKLTVSLVVLLVACLPAFGQAKKQAPPAAKGQSVEQELIKLEKEWADAGVKADVATAARLMADDYIGTDFEGNLWTKSKALDAMKSGEDKVSSVSLYDMKVRVYGDTAVVTGGATVKEVYKGRDLSGQYRFTDAWVKRDGRWQCVAGQGTKIVKK